MSTLDGNNVNYSSHFYIHHLCGSAFFLLESAITTLCPLFQIYKKEKISSELFSPFLVHSSLMREGDDEADIGRLPIDLLAHIFSLFTSFKDLAQ